MKKRIGMLWLDQTTDTIEEKIKKAIIYYQKKYQQDPPWIYVDPRETNIPEIVMGVKIFPRLKLYSPNFLWVGREAAVD